MVAPGQTTVRTWTESQRRWSGVHNFLLAGECVPFAFDLPPLDRVVAELRAAQDGTDCDTARDALVLLAGLLGARRDGVAQ